MMWILNQDKNKLINADKLTCIALGKVGVNQSIEICDGNEWHTIGIYDGSSNAGTTELMRIFDNIDYGYHIMAQRGEKDQKRISSVAQRKRGEWVDDGFLDRKTCSVCGAWIADNTGTAELNYCPNCGAYMKGENNAE